MVWIYIVLMAQSIVASIAMAINYHTTYWGGLNVFGLYEISAQSNIATFDSGVWVGTVGVWYLVSQILPLTVGRSRSPWAVTLAMVSSWPAIVEMGAVLLKYYVLGGIPLSAYQFGAMKIWSVVELDDLLLFVVSFYLLLRAIGVVQTVDTK